MGSSTRSPQLARLVLTAGLVVASVLGVARPAAAATLTYSGAWDGSQPTMPVVGITPPNCTVQLTTPVAYTVIPYTPLVDGPVSFSVVTDQDGMSTSIYVMQAGFDPEAAFPFCLAGSNGGSGPTVPATLTYEMTGGTPYEIVLINDEPLPQPPHAWTLTIETVPAADMKIGVTGGGTFRPGDTVGFEVPIEHLGTDDAMDSEVVVTLPDEFAGGSIADLAVAGAPDYSCAVSDRTVACTASLHQVGDDTTISFVATIADDIVGDREVEVVAQVRADSPQLANIGDDVATTLIVIDAPEQPMTTTTAEPAPRSTQAAPRFTG